MENRPVLKGFGAAARKSRPMLAHSFVQERDLNHRTIAHQHIQDRRARKRVPCGPGGVLHDYVPFFFAPRPPMLYAIKMGIVESYEGKQAPLIYLVTTVQTVSDAGGEWVFTDGHGTMTFTEFFDDIAGLDEVDWAVMESRYWYDTNEDPDRTRRRQAEFLIKDICPWNLINEIGVMNKSMQAPVEEVLEMGDHCPVISLRREWYY